MQNGVAPKRQRFDEDLSAVKESEDHEEESKIALDSFRALQNTVTPNKDNHDFYSVKKFNETLSQMDMIKGSV